MIDILSISCDIALIWMPQDLTNEKTILPLGITLLPEPTCTQTSVVVASLGHNELTAKYMVNLYYCHRVLYVKPKYGWMFLCIYAKA